MTDNPADILADAIDDFDAILKRIGAGPAGPVEEQPTAIVFDALVAIHRVHHAAGAVADGLLLALRDPDRRDRPSLRALGHRLGLHHSTVAERITRAENTVNAAPTVANIDPALLRAELIYLQRGCCGWECLGFSAYPFGRWHDAPIDEPPFDAAAAAVREKLGVAVLRWSTHYPAGDSDREDPFYVARLAGDHPAAKGGG